MLHLSFPPLFWAITIEKAFEHLLTNQLPLCNPAKIWEAAQNPKKIVKKLSFANIG